MILRPYQRDAVEAVYRHLRERDDQPCVVIPTAGGKSVVIATICRDAVQRWQGRVLLVTHVRELIEQNVDKILRLAPDLAPLIGINSAGLGQRDTAHPIIAAGIQSIYQQAAALGHFDLAVVDECHLLPADGEGRYLTFFAAARRINPRLRVIGFTATPYRLSSGPLCAPNNVLNHICYEVGVRELIDQGFLAPLVAKAGQAKVDTAGLQVRGGEFVAGAAEELMDHEQLVASACQEIVSHTVTRKSVLIFAAGIRHGRHLAQVLGELTGATIGQVYGDTLAFERDETLAQFRDGRLKYLVNVGVLTTGFDAPNIDCIVLLRPTNSTGLFVQMLGRGFRLHPGKNDCAVLDFAGNVLRHGPVDAVAVHQDGGRDAADEPDRKQAKAVECPTCRALLPRGTDVCPHCSYLFPLPKIQHEARAAAAAVLAPAGSVVEYDVADTQYFVHHKRGAPPDAPRTLRVDYCVGFNQLCSEWVCFEHHGWARHKAETWWRQRSRALLPATAAEAAQLAHSGAVARTRRITVRRVEGERLDRIIAHTLAAVPPWREPGWDEDEPLPATVASVPTDNSDPLPF